MIELTVLEHLSERLPEKVVLERDGNEPPFVLIEKTGGGSENRISRATFALQSYAGSLAEAAKLNERVKAAAYTMTEQKGIFSVKLSSDYNYTNTQTKNYRYQAVIEIRYTEELEDK